MYIPNDGKSGDGEHDGRIHHLDHVVVDVVLLQSSVLETYNVIATCVRYMSV